MDSLLSPRNWQRRLQPILHASDAQDWCAVCLYSPAVLKVGDRYRMWFIGTSATTRSTSHALGYAESANGVEWELYEGNPILTPDDLPWGSNWQTPEVHYDQSMGCYRMWFSTVTEVEWKQRQGREPTCHYMEQALGHATSEDGIHWDVCAEPLYPSGRGPSVMAMDDGYVMWMGSRPSDASPWQSFLENIYRFTSPDGLDWRRDPEPAVRPAGILKTCVYPCVRRTADGYIMLHGGHDNNRGFAIFSASSADGLAWEPHHQSPMLPPSGVDDAFDGRYTSTPCLLRVQGEHLLYYSGRSLATTYTAPDGTIHIDRQGVYAGIGLTRYEISSAD